MQTNRKGESEPQGSPNDLDADPSLQESGLPELTNDLSDKPEEMKLVTTAELESRKEEKQADAKAKGMDNKSDSSSPKEPARKVDAQAQGRDFIQFLREVYLEFRKISWPGSKEVMQATWSVLALVAVITLLVLGFDWVLGHAFFSPLEHWARLHGGGLGVGR